MASWRIVTRRDLESTCRTTPTSGYSTDVRACFDVLDDFEGVIGVLVV
jgi:hypothetical protein